MNKLTFKHVLGESCDNPPSSEHCTVDTCEVFSVAVDVYTCQHHTQFDSHTTVSGANV